MNRTSGKMILTVVFAGIFFGHLPPLVWGMGIDQQQQHSYGPLTLGTTSDDSNHRH